MTEELLKRYNLVIDELLELAKIGPTLDLKECCRMSAADLLQFKIEAQQDSEINETE